MKWFRHDVSMNSNRKIRKLIRVHGATGYAFWCILLEKIYLAEGDFQIEADELWFEDISEDLRLGDYRTPIRILDTLSELGLISSQLWQEHVIFLPAIAERGDAYLNKRVAETEKKRKQRAKKSQLSPGDKVGTRGQKGEMSPSDPDPDPERNITNSLTLTEQPEKSANAEKISSNLENTLSNPLETISNPLDMETYQLTREEGKKANLEPLQEINNLSIVSNYQTSNLKTSTNPEFLREDKGAAARTTKPDKTVGLFGKPTLQTSQKERAKKASTARLIETGIKNARWSDRAGYERFEAYVVEHCRQCNVGLKKDFGKIENPDKYIPAMLRRVSNCTDDNSVDLSIWKAWTTEVPAPPLVEAKPFEIIETSPETMAIFEAFKAQAAIDKAAREAAAQAKADWLREAWGDVA